MSTLTGNRGAFLDMIAWSEIGPALLAASDDGYNVIVGSTSAAPDLFASYATHPNKLVTLRNGIQSTAAGRYQLLHRYFLSYSALLGLLDFSPDSQDAIAIQQIRETGALPLVDAGRVPEAVARVSHLWASLPGANYADQHMQQLSDLQRAYQNAGGMSA